ncbi:MAG: alpha-galactosidase [Lentisphaeria bacterium]|nr:alpha-galactosidase [Lentisphaeria bacterium]
MKLPNLLCTLLLLAAFTLPAAAKRIPSEIGEVKFSLLRDSRDFTKTPKLKAENKGGAPAEFRVRTTLTDRSGKVESISESKLAVPAGGSAEIDPFGGKAGRIAGDVKLYRSEISGNGGAAAVSGIFGEAKPVPPGAGDLFGMNVHLGWYDPDVQWELLRKLAAAGITQVRCDFSFRDLREKEAIERGFAELKETILGLEAFGIRPLVLLGYFPKSFYNSPDKLKMAHDWAELAGRELKGRCDYNYGNETNSGWAGFGEAAAMATLNNAFALGTAKSDPQAGKASFGIAEGLENYVIEFIRANGLEYLDALCIHPYCGTPEAGIAKSAASKALIRAAGGDRQLWLTEIGFQVDEEGKFNELTGELTGVAGFSPRHQAEFLPRLYILASSHGIDRVYWYNFFGRDDGETFWLLDRNFNPRPAYHSLVECVKQLKGAAPLGGSPFGDLIQRHGFRRADGSTLLAAWALKDNVPADFLLPAGTKVADCAGKPVALPADGRLVLGHGPVYIENPPEALLYDRSAAASPMDKRNFSRPLFRFSVKPGESVEIPLAVYNGSDKAKRAAGRVTGTNPGWKTAIPAELEVPAGKTATAAFRLTAPADAVPGVEYEFTFDAVIDDMQRTLPYTVRVKTEGTFPYRAIRDAAKSGSYPMWDPMDETKAGTGNPELTASYGTAKIDGDLAEWKPEEFFPIDQRFQWILRDAGIPSTEDWSGRAAFRWDGKKLYAAFLIEDDELNFADFVSRDWRDSDNIRLFVSSVSDPAKRAKKITADDLLLIMTPTGITKSEGPLLNAASLGGLVRTGVEKEVEMKSRVWKNGYVLEVAVPFCLFNAEPEAGSVLGLNVMADDIDRGFRQHVGMTFYRNANYWNSPASLGGLKLVK